jgi:hypothetical protein
MYPFLFHCKQRTLTLQYQPAFKISRIVSPAKTAVEFSLVKIYPGFLCKAFCCKKQNANKLYDFVMHKFIL